VTPDHLDRHGDLAGYATAKRRLLANQRPTDVAILSFDDPIVRAIAGRSGPLLEVPIGLTIYGPLPGYQAQAMYRAIFHRRPLLNGYGGYWPDGFIARMLRATALPAPDALAFLRRETGLTTVVVNADHLEPAEAASWQRRLDDGMPGLELRGRFGEGVVLDVAE